MKYTGLVKRVVDGDTIHVIIKETFFDIELSTDITVRMLGIDAPETKGNPDEKALGLKTKAWLKEKIEGQTITIELTEKDVYKRWLGTVFLEEVNINELMVKEHLVEKYTGSARHNDGILDIEE